MKIGENCRRICLSTNTSCNLRCRYCYELKKDSGSFSVERVYSILNSILSRKTKDGTRIKLHGGEPFLIFPKIKELCEKLWDSGFPEYFMIHMTTNGTLVQGDVQDWLYEHRNQIRLKLSLDGGETIHNLNRPDSFNHIDIDFFKRTWSDVNIKMTVSPWTLMDFHIAVIQLYELGFRNISSSFAEMVDWGEDCDFVFYNELKKLYQYCTTNNISHICNFFDVDFHRTCNSHTVYHPCTLDIKEAYDYESDKFYPCHFYFESTAGTQKSTELMSIDLSLEQNRVSGDCKLCKFISLCHTCYAANYLYRNATSQRDPIMCKLQKAQFLAVAEFEYSRILNLSSSEISIKDVKQLKAIKYLLPQLREIKENFQRCQI